MRMDLTGQHVLVTGGTRGIGRAIVERFLAAGALVSFCAPDETECREVAENLTNSRSLLAGRVIGFRADLHERTSLDNLVESVQKALGPIDVLVCNAADFGHNARVPDQDCAVFERVLTANVVNNFRLCQLVLPGMAARKSGSVILLSSIAGFTTMPGNVAYAASKAAILSMSRSLAAAYAADGVRVNCVAPGLIKTEASREIWQDETVARRYLEEKVPMRRIGMPDEIADACLFLASSASRYMTAACINIDGGRQGIGQPAGFIPPPAA